MFNLRFMYNHQRWSKLEDFQGSHEVMINNFSKYILTSKHEKYVTFQLSFQKWSNIKLLCKIRLWNLTCNVLDLWKVSSLKNVKQQGLKQLRNIYHQNTSWILSRIFSQSYFFESNSDDFHFREINLIYFCSI